MVHRFLKYGVCFFCTAVFLVHGILASFADEKDEDAVSHNAGKDCLTIGCHASGGWKRFYLAGTIYTDSEGTAARAGAQIKAEDANGTTVNLTSDALGSFFSAQSMTAPFTISVSFRGRRVKMPGTASIGGCNADGCHVVGSAGRVHISTNDIDLTGTVTGTDAENSPDARTNNITPISGAKVSLSLKGRIKYRTTTGSAGAFTLKKVKANEYTMKVARKGYKAYKQSYEMKQKDVSSLEITLNKK